MHRKVNVSVPNLEQNETETPFIRLRRLLSPDKKDIVLIVSYGVCSGIFALVVPIAVQTLVNTIAFGSMLQPILVLTILVFLVLGLSAFLRGLQIYLMEVIQQRIFARTSIHLAMRIPQLNVETFEGHSGPELMNRFFDVLTVQKSTALIVIDGLSIVLQTGVGMMLLAFYHPFLLAFDIVLVGMIFGLVFFLGKGAVQSSILESKKKYAVAGWLEELARLPILFKNPVAESFVLKQSDHLTVKYLKTRKSHFTILMRQIFGALTLQVCASSILLGLGGWLVVKRQLTLGQLVAAELVVTSVVTGVGKFGKYLESYYDLVAAADKLGYLLDLPVEDQGQVEIPTKSSPSDTVSLSLGNVHYAYQQKEACLRGVSLRVKSGDKVGICGGRSSGKSTLADILYLLKKPTQGRLELGGISHLDISLQNYRRGVCFLRGIDLFEGSIAENLQIHHLSSVEEIYAVFEQLGILNEVKALSKGLNTQISGGNSPLSSGLAKFIILGRTILAKPRLLLIDSFLDDLDDQSKDLAVRVLGQMSSTTVIMMTGSEMLARKWKNSYFLVHGKLVESGEVS